MENETSIQPKMEGEQRPEFHIDSESAANWYLRKKAAIRAERELVKAQVESILRGLDSDELSLDSRFKAEFEQYVAERISGGKTKTCKFLFGTAAFRTVAGHWAIGDKATALQTAKLICPDAVRIVEDLDSKALLEHVDATGEIVPGVERVPERESFSISFPKTKSQAEAVASGDAME